jgi:hypothetical protein
MVVIILPISICLLFRYAYLPRSRSAHLIPYLGIELASAVAKIDKWNNSSLNEEPRSDSRLNKHAKSHQCPGKPGAPQTNLKKSQRLPRTPFKTFPLRERRDHEGPVLGLSRPQNTQTHIPVSLDPAFERGFVRDGQIGENLAVQAYASSFESFRKTAEGHSIRAASRI